MTAMVVLRLMLLTVIVLTVDGARKTGQLGIGDIDVDKILRNERLFTSYAKCLLDKGKCTPDGAELKRRMPETIRNDCNKCTAREKLEGHKVLRYMIKNKASTYAEIERKYDPSGSYLKKHRAEVLAAPVIGGAKPKPKAG